MSIIFLNKNENLNVIKTNFENNNVEDETINIIYGSVVNITNVIFQKNNILQKSKEGKGYGGCMRTLNVYFRFFQNVIIIDSITNQKAVGLKLVDNDFNNYEFLLNKFGGPKVIIILELLTNSFDRLLLLDVNSLTTMFFTLLQTKQVELFF